MVGLFKKLGKKKPRSRKKNYSASEDESCTEDEGPEKSLPFNRFTPPTSARREPSNGICNVTPDECSNDDKFDCGNNSNPQSPHGSNFDGQFGNGDMIIDAFDNDDILSVNSAEEGSLFDEDILSQFQDGQISLQQFLQSPHLSRSEERIRDEEMDSFFSDSRSVESSNYYSDSSSGSNRTEQRDEELDRIAGEMFGDYGEKFANAEDCFAIHKTHDNGDAREHDAQSLGNFSVGERTVTNSLSTLTITADDNDCKNFPDVSAYIHSEEKRVNFSPSVTTITDKLTTIVSSSRPTSSSPCRTSVVEVSKSSQNCFAEISFNEAGNSSSEGNSSFACTQSTSNEIPLHESSLPLSAAFISKDSSSSFEANSKVEAPKTLLDRILENSKSAVIEASKGNDTSSSPSGYLHTSSRNISPFEGATVVNSRPCSAQSQLSQREVAIIENTVVSSSGRYVLSSGSKDLEAQVQAKIDPWLSYLPDWKVDATKEPASDDCVEKTSLAYKEGVYESCKTPIKDILRPTSALPRSPSNSSDQDRYIRFSSLDLDFFIPPPPADEDTISIAQNVTVEATPFNLEWDYEIVGSPTITPSSSVICIGNGENSTDNVDPIGESLLSLLPIDAERFEGSVSTALGEIITEIVSSRQKILKLTRIVEFQDMQLKEQRKLIESQASKLLQINCASVTSDAPRIARSPLNVRRNEFKSYPATGRRSKELVDLENTLDKLLFQCHSLQNDPSSRGDLQVFQPIDREEALSRADSRNSDDSVVEVKALLCRKIPESPANHVQIVPAKGVVYNSCKEMKDDMNAIRN